jgi:hypothetical protein
MNASLRLALRFACALTLALGLAACGEDECETSQDCPEVECDDGGSFRACVEGECQTEC